MVTTVGELHCVTRRPKRLSTMSGNDQAGARTLSGYKRQSLSHLSSLISHLSSLISHLSLSLSLSLMHVLSAPK